MPERIINNATVTVYECPVCGIGNMEQTGDTSFPDSDTPMHGHQCPSCHHVQWMPKRYPVILCQD